jgi:hypothetical protein
MFNKLTPEEERVIVHKDGTPFSGEFDEFSEGTMRAEVQCAALPAKSKFASGALPISDEK